MSKLVIRQEKSKDYKSVAILIEEAFRKEELSDGSEPFLVERLRKSKAFIPELSLVAELNNEVVGHVLLTLILIKGKNKSTESLALAPVSVKPDYQSQGIGGSLIERAHEISIEMKYKSIVLLGHENYYPRFGYERASKYGITIPFDAPDENCMVIELEDGGLSGVSGMVEYAPEFFA